MWDPGASHRAFCKEHRLSPKDEWELDREDGAAGAEEKDGQANVKSEKQLRMAKLRTGEERKLVRKPGQIQSLSSHSKADRWAGSEVL